MTIKIKAGDLMDSISSLKAFAAFDVPIKTGFKLQRILRKVQTEVDTVQKLREMLLEKHTEKDGVGRKVHPQDAVGKPITTQFKLADPDAYRVDLEELNTTEITIGIDQIDPDELGDKIVVKSGVLMMLHWLFKE